MSLIHEMLKDLEARESEERQKNPLNLGLKSQSVPDAKRPFLFSIKGFILVSGITVAAVYSWHQAGFLKVQTGFASAVSTIEQLVDSSLQTAPLQDKQTKQEQPSNEPDYSDIQRHIKPVPVVAQEKSSLMKKPSQDFSNYKQIKQANYYLEQGREKLAIKALNSVRQSSPNYLPAIQLLLKHHTENNHYDQVESLLAETKNHTAHPELVMQYAKAIQGEEIDRAIKMLSIYSPAVTQMPRYHALLAAYEHQAGQDTQARDRYLNLLSVDDAKGAYWLGLAVSAEALGETNQAMAAYRYALADPKLAQSTRAAVTRKLATL